MIARSNFSARNFCIFAGLFVVGALGGWLSGTDAAHPRLGGDDSAQLTPPARPGGKRLARGADADSRTVDFFTHLHLAWSMSNDDEKALAIAEAVSELDAGQVRAALAQLKKGRFAGRMEVIAQLYTRWGELDPHAALESAQALTDHAQSNGAILAVVGAWAENDRSAAEAWISKLPAGKFKSSALTELIISTAAKEPERALQLAAATDIPPNLADGVVDALFNQWAQNDPAAAGRAVALLPEGALRVKAIRFVAKQWTEANPRAAVEWADLTTPSSDDGVSNGGYRKGNALNSVIDVWVRRDPDAASDWIAEMPDGPRKKSLTQVACSICVESSHDPVRAARLIALLPDEKDRDWQLEQCADRVALFDPAIATTWVKGLSDPTLERKLLPDLLDWSSGDELRTVLDEMQKLNAASDAPISISFLLFSGDSDPNTLADWVSKQADPSPYVGTVASAWMKYDPDSAVQWINKLPDAQKDQALLGVVTRIRSVPGESALDTQDYFQNLAQWVPQIGDPAIRDDAAKQLAKLWIKLAPDSGRAWLGAAPVSPQVKADLLAPEATGQ